ncbi:hypothetical protein [Nocardia jiangxiensis]|uniref:hypothetical protein n=1 Tax=Nocardia jiangxiensis TaxID=282685 RepID=UPI0002EE409F|nr:hypothetical protein [Nocardia jiangxiensis]
MQGVLPSGVALNEFGLRRDGMRVDREAGEPVARSGCRLVVLGDQLVNGRRVTSTRTLEFVLALVFNGGECRASSLVGNLCSGQASKSAIPTLAYRARQLGIDTEFISFRTSYHLVTEVTVDAVELLEALHIGDVHTALRLYGGPLLVNSHTRAIIETRARIDRELTEAAIASGDDALARQVAWKAGNSERGLVHGLSERVPARTRSWSS